MMLLFNYYPRNTTLDFPVTYNPRPGLYVFA